MKVITFSRFFPATHPRKGEPTFFVEKIWLWGHNEDGWSEPSFFPEYRDHVDIMKVLGQDHPKYHTIRGGHRWKVGDWFSPRIWSGKPYASKQIEFAPPIQIKKVWEIQIEGYIIHIGKRPFSRYPEHAFKLAKNDGLGVHDFWSWFPYKPGKIFIGQILCWNENIEYLPNSIPGEERSVARDGELSFKS